MKKKLVPLTILHSNDMHGDFLSETIDDKLVGGVSMLSGYINKVRNEQPNTLYCIAGDMFRGSVIDSEYQGISTIEIMNMLAPDVVTLGNHEADYGVAHMLFIEKCANFPIINANMYIKTNHARMFQPYLVKEVDGMRILFIGILTEEVLAKTKTDKVLGMMVDVDDAADTVTRICNAHNSIDIDFTVLLTHIGFEADKELAAKLDPECGVDVIIGGHSHTLLEEPVMVNGIAIVQAGIGTNQIGRFDLMVDTEKNAFDSLHWETVPIDAEHCPRDPEIEKLIESYKQETDKKYGRVITRFRNKLTHPSRIEETTLGNMIADALQAMLGVDIMLQGSGGIRVESVGPVVTYGDLLEVYPYDDEIYFLKVSGAQFRRMMQHVFRDEVWQGAHVEFYQVSKGVRLVYDRAAGAFTEFLFDGVPIEDEHIYNIGMEKYHFSNFEDFFGVPVEEITANGTPRKVATSCREILEEYMSEHQLMRVQLEGRIVVN